MARVLTPELALCGWGQRCRQGVKGIDPPTIGCRLRTHRPVAAEGHAILPKDLKHMRDVWLEIVGRPVVGVSFGDKSTDLTGDIGQRRKRSHLRTPWIEHMTFDIRLGDVIEHETCLGAAADKLNSIAKLPVIYADIKRKAILGQ